MATTQANKGQTRNAPYRQTQVVELASQLYVQLFAQTGNTVTPQHNAKESLRRAKVFYQAARDFIESEDNDE